MSVKRRSVEPVEHVNEREREKGEGRERENYECARESVGGNVESTSGREIKIERE